METLGEKLKTIRTQKGISLEEISQITKIKVSSLEAIEADDFDRLPSTVYTKSFIRLYASHLGLDGNDCVREYISAQPGDRKKENKIFSIQQPITYQRRIPTGRGRKIPLPAIFLVLLLALAAMGVAWMSLHPRTGGQQAPAGPAGSALSAKAAKALPPELQKYFYIFPEGAGYPRQLQIETTGNVWISVKTPSVYLFEGMLGPAARESWNFSEPLTVKISAPDKVRMSVNQQPVALPGTGVMLLLIEQAGIRLAGANEPGGA